MSKAYRGDLEAAQARIRQLEEELASLPAPPKRPFLWSAAIITPLVGLAVGGFLAISIRRPIGEPPPIAVTPTAPAEVAAITLQPYVRIGLAPALADVNQDGVEDVILPMWNESNHDAALHLLALDGKTMNPLWGAGPWASAWGSHQVHVQTNGEHVVISDSRGGIHLLDLKTGASRGEHKLDMPTDSLCLTADDQIVMSIQRLNAKTMQPTTGSSPCVSHGLPHCVSPRTYPCIDTMPARETTKMNGYVRIEDRDFTIHLGMAKTMSADPKERAAPYADARKRAGGVQLWEGPLVAPGDRVYLGTDRDAYANGILFDVYQELKGPFRITAHKGETGQLVWASTLTGTDELSRLMSMAVSSSGSHVFVVVDNALHVLNGETGEMVRIVQHINQLP